jgi:Tol biopolymer transport system component
MKATPDRPGSRRQQDDNPHTTEKEDRMTTEQTHTWTFENQLYYPLIGEGDLSPDGRNVVFTVQEPIMTAEASKFVFHLYLAATEGGDPRQLTFGEHSNCMPKWSPDGRYIAFLSNRVADKNNLYVLDSLGGEAWPLTRYDKTDIVRFAWAPDGRYIAFLMAEPPTEAKEKANKAKDDYLRWDIDFDFAQLYRVPFEVGPRQLPEVRQLTTGRRHALDFDWLPDGSRLALSYAPTPVAEDWPQTRLALVDTAAEAAESAELIDVAPLRSWSPAPKVSPDGRWIACVTGDQPARWAFASRVVLYPTAGGDPRPLAETPDFQPTPIGWAADSRSFYVSEANSVNTQFYRLPVSGEVVQPVTSTPTNKWPLAVNRAGQLLFREQDFHQLNRLALLDDQTGASQPITTPLRPANWPDAPLPRAEVVRWSAPDGLEIEGIVVYYY